MVTMSIIRKETQEKKSRLQRLARTAGKAAGFLAFHAPRARAKLSEKAKSSYERSISAYERGLALIEKAQKEQRRLKRLARKGRRTLKGKHRRKHRKVNMHRRRRR